MTKSVCFDVIGTCFGFTGAIEAIEQRLGPKLSKIGVDPKALFFGWFFAGQRDFTYASLCGDFKPIATVLKSTFKRSCAVVDLPIEEVSDEDVEAVMTAFKALQPREGLKNCYDGLRAAGWDVYGVTNGGKETSLNYYRRANIELDENHLLSCDDIQIAKPDPRVYDSAHKWLTSRGLGAQGDGDRWFVAAHGWDLMAARTAGFRTAYLYFEEHDPVQEVFGKFDIYAKDMDELLAKMKAL